MSECERERKFIRAKSESFWKISFIYCPSNQHFFRFQFSALTFYEFIFPSHTFILAYFVAFKHTSMYVSEREMWRWGGGWWWWEDDEEKERKWNEIPPSSPVMKNKKKSIAKESLIFLLFHISLSLSPHTHHGDEARGGAQIWWFLYTHNLMFWHYFSVTSIVKIEMEKNLSLSWK